MEHSAALNTLAALVLEDGSRFGDVASEFQWNDAAAILSDEGPRWHYVTRPRGGSKTTDLGGILIAWLVCLAAPGARGYAWATDEDQAHLLIDAAAGLVDRTYELQDFIKLQGGKLVAKSGATVEARGSDGGGSFGLRPAFLVADELSNWEETRRIRKTWSAIMSSLAKTPGCRLAILTTAGEPSHFSHKMLMDAKSNPERWHVSETLGPLPWVDYESLVAQGLTESEFARLHLNQWTQADDSLALPEDIAAACVLEGELPPVGGNDYVMAVDLGLIHDRSVVAVGHAEVIPSDPGGARRVVIDSLRRWRGRRLKPVDLVEVESYIAVQAERYKARVIIDPWQAAAMSQRLTAMGIAVSPYVFTANSAGRLGQALHLALRTHRIWLPDDDALASELARVRLRATGLGGARFETTAKADHDDQAVCLALICSELAGTSSNPYSARAYLESFARTCDACGMPNRKAAQWCSKCRAPLPPEIPSEVLTEPPGPMPRHPAPTQPVGWLWAPGEDREPDPHTVDVLRQLEQANRQGWQRRF